MPFIPVALDLPPDVVEMRSGDVDADGKDDLVVISKRQRDGQPDAVSINVLSINDEGGETARWAIDLTDQALLIDVEKGLWALGATGLMALGSDGVRTVVESRTPLSGLGRTAATFADVFSDVDGDGIPEGVLTQGGSIRVVGVDGTQHAQVQVRGRGELDIRQRGGTQIVASTVSPLWHLDDFDGDGTKDLLLPDGQKLTVVSMGQGASDSPLNVNLPIDISPPKDNEKRKKGDTKKRVISVWLDDVDGDGKTDFAAQIWVTKGSWLGSEGEIVFSRGTGAGFGPLERFASDRAVLMVRLLDVDGDGDKDLASAEMDFGVGNLTRALLTQKIKVDLMVRQMDLKTVSDSSLLHSVVVPISSDREPPVTIEHDLTGDGIPDMVSAQEGKSVQLFKGTGTGFEKNAVAEFEIDFKRGEDRLWVGDITGDKRAEVVVWRPRSKSAKLLQVREE